MRLTDILVDIGNAVAYYPKLVDVTGGVLPNLFLCQMYYWLGKQKNPEGWIYKSQAEIERETGLTRKEQETARKSLKARGLLKEKFIGCPRRVEFWLDKDALNQRWSAFMNNIELPIEEITKAWTRKSKKNDSESRQTPGIMPQKDNIDSPNSAICNAFTEQYILPEKDITQCPVWTYSNAPSGHTVMPHVGNTSIYTKNTSEITTQNAPPKPGAPPTHESVCEEKTGLKKQPNQEQEPIPQFFASLRDATRTLSIKPESSSQPDNPSSGSNLPAGSFDKGEQTNYDTAPTTHLVQGISDDSKPLHPTPNPQHPILDPYKSAQNVEELIEAWITDPTAFADDCVPLVVKDQIKWQRWVLPWRTQGRKLNHLYQNFNPIVVDFLAQELATGGASTKAQKITHAIAVMNTWEKTKGGWTNLMQRYYQAKRANAAPQNTSTHLPTSEAHKNLTLCEALSQDELRRQQEQSKRNSSCSRPQTVDLDLKSKLEQAANAQKIHKVSQKSTANLREVEALIKQALGA
ncbi:MAG: hypothetical protein KME59_14540 [Trichormus sp. ATA11-4-KO1]|jgi:hypothetical protein|nr:hypothetical protein [Trichormus sp. ATA11-4-KO1]